MYRDRVCETSTSTGTGSFTLSGPVAGYRSFSAAFGAVGAYYAIVNRDAPGEWEIGSFTVSGATLSRVAGNVLSGSAGAGTLVNFSAGTKDVFNSPPASAMQTWDSMDASNRVLKSGDTMTGQLTGTAFQSAGTAGTTGFKISGGTDLASIFQAAGGTPITAGSGSGAQFGDVNPRLTSASLTRSGNTATLTVGAACNCNCNCNCVNGCSCLCIPAGTQVRLADGRLKSVELLEMGDQVLGREGRINNVLALYTTQLGDRALYCLNNSLQLTGDHMIWTQKGWAVFDLRLYGERVRFRSRTLALGLGHEPEMNWQQDELSSLAAGDVLTFRGAPQPLTEINVIEDTNPDLMLFCPIIDGDQSFEANGYIIDGFADKRFDFRTDLLQHEELPLL